MEKLEGYIDHIIYRNSENGYTVMVLTNQDGEITCVGNLSYINEGERKAEGAGNRSIHPGRELAYRVAEVEGRWSENHRS